MHQRSYRKLFLFLAISMFAIDQGSKYWMFANLYEEGKPTGAMEVVPGWFRFHTIYDPKHEVNYECALTRLNGPVTPQVNQGSLFSMLGSQGSRANHLFLGVSVLAIIGVAIWGTRPSTGRDFLLTLSLGLILGGTLGNCYDRALFNGVRDFMHFYKINWPIFNYADCCLVAGAIGLVIQAYRTQGEEKKAAATTTVAVAATSTIPVAPSSVAPEANSTAPTEVVRPKLPTAPQG